MGYNDTYNDLMKQLNSNNTQTSGFVNEDNVKNNTVTTVYDDFKLTVTNDTFTAAGLNNNQKIIVYISNSQNAVYLTNKSSLGNEFSVSKILKHTPNKGIRLNIGRLLNIGTVPCQMVVQTSEEMIKVYPKDGLSKLPADKAYETVCNTIEKVYGFNIQEFLARIENGVI